MKLRPIPFDSPRAAFSGVQLLIVLALSLCGLSAWQWVRDTNLHSENSRLQAQIAILSQTTNDLAKNTISLNAEIARVEALRTTLSIDIQSNKTTVRRLVDDFRTASNAERVATNSLANCKRALEAANDNIRKATNTLLEFAKANKLLADGAKDREELVRRLNEATSQARSLFDERETLAKELNRIRSTTAAALK